MPAPCVFFDRDGIVNIVPEGVYYVSRDEDFHLTEPFFAALRIALSRGYRAAIATNQKGVFTGATPIAVLHAMHDRLRREAEGRGLRLDGIYYCPHGEPCDCRKPKPGLLTRAARELDLDLGRSWMIGDSPRDCEAGRAAGCRTILVNPDAPCPHADIRLPRLEDLPAWLDQHLPPVAAS